MFNSQNPLINLLKNKLIIVSSMVCVATFTATSSAIADTAPVNTGYTPVPASNSVVNMPGQSFTVSAAVTQVDVSRDGYTATDPKVLQAREDAKKKAIADAAAAKKAAEDAAIAKAQAAKLAAEAKTSSPTGSVVAPSFTPDPGSAQAYAQQAVLARGWSEADYNCLVSLWNKESGWRANASNGSSGAYGIPQALPGSKMASAGADWQTNANTQINWGLGYIAGSYGTPCNAWAHSVAVNWY